MIALLCIVGLVGVIAIIAFLFPSDSEIEILEREQINQWIEESRRD